MVYQFLQLTTFETLTLYFLVTNHEMSITKWSQQQPITNLAWYNTHSPLYFLPVSKDSYLSLVHSEITYCSQLWRPQVIKYIKALKRIQRRATKYISSVSILDYQSRLISPYFLPLMYFYEPSDIIFFVKYLLSLDPGFPILKYVSFSSCATCSGLSTKLAHQLQSSPHSQHFSLTK